MKLLTEKQSKVFESLKDELGLKNVMQTPSIEKIIVNVGTGTRQKRDRKANEFIAAQLATITGQKPAGRKAKMSIAGFKVREGDVVGQSVTMRGERMNSFFDKLVNVALPRTKDFRGLETKGIDSMGNLTLGIKEHTIFPETGDEELQNIFGLSVTIVTTATDKESAEAYLRFLGVPFKKTDLEKEKLAAAADKKAKAAKVQQKALLAKEQSQAEAVEAGQIVSASDAGVTTEETSSEAETAE
jgi:large subunit ribosomal protein L5